MTLKFTPPGPDPEMKPRIVVVGVGGAGGNAVNNMISSNLEGVEFVVANTDAQALGHSNAERCIQLGTTLTKGLGAGAQPELGRAAAEEALPDLMDHLGGANMLFITAGMGGGTGTGAAPVIAEAAREHGMLTVGVVTKPFHFEGKHRMKLAEQGIEELASFVDTLIIIPNQNLFRVANEKTTFADAFKMADDVLHSGVRGVTDLMVMPGLINLDFADIRTVMSEMGKAMMGTGEASGEDRAREAAEAAISNPLLEDVTMKGALGVLINITGGPDMTLFEVDEAANRIREEVDENANIIFGSTFEESLEGKMRVSVVATGIEAEANAQPRPVPTRTIGLTRPKRITPEPEEAAPAPAPAAVVAETPKPIVEDVAKEEPAETPSSEEPEVSVAATHVEATPVAEAPAPAVEEPQLFDDLAAPEPQPIQPEARPAAAAMDPAPGMAEKPRRPEVPTPRDAFIPPPPARVEPKLDSQAGPEADPFAEAEYANGRSEKPKKQRTNLFRRVTNVLGAKPAQDEAPAETGGAAPSATPAVQSRAATAQQRQPSLDAPPPSERMEPSSAAESELLEIPAFLRRQAN